MCSVHLAYLVSGGELEAMVRFLSSFELHSLPLAPCSLLCALCSIAPFETRPCRASLYCISGCPSSMVLKSPVRNHRPLSLVPVSRCEI